MNQKCFKNILSCYKNDSQLPSPDKGLVLIEVSPTTGIRKKVKPTLVLWYTFLILDWVLIDYDRGVVLCNLPFSCNYTFAWMITMFIYLNEDETFISIPTPFFFRESLYQILEFVRLECFMIIYINNCKEMLSFQLTC